MIMRCCKCKQELEYNNEIGLYACNTSECPGSKKEILKNFHEKGN